MVDIPFSNATWWKKSQKVYYLHTQHVFVHEWMDVFPQAMSSWWLKPIWKVCCQIGSFPQGYGTFFCTSSTVAGIWVKLKIFETTRYVWMDFGDTQNSKKSEDSCTHIYGPLRTHKICAFSSNVFIFYSSQICAFSQPWRVKTTKKNSELPPPRYGCFRKWWYPTTIGFPY